MYQNLINRKILSLVVFFLLLLSIPVTIILVRQQQDIRQRAVASTVTCQTADSNFPNGYEYPPGALDVWVVVTENNGDVGPIPGVSVHAQALHNNEPPVGHPNHARTEIDGPGCGFSADGTTDSHGFTHLEPLNCGHNNFALAIPSGLPPDVIYDDATLNDGPRGIVNVSQLELANGVTNVIKLFYKRRAPIIPTPTPTPTPFPFQPFTPQATVTPTPSTCPVPQQVTNVIVECPFCQ